MARGQLELLVAYTWKVHSTDAQTDWSQLLMSLKQLTIRDYVAAYPSHCWTGGCSRLGSETKRSSRQLQQHNMTERKPVPLSKIADAVLIDTEGQEHEAKDLWKSQPVILLLVQRPGCGMLALSLFAIAAEAAALSAVESPSKRNMTKKHLDFVFLSQLG